MELGSITKTYPIKRQLNTLPRNSAKNAFLPYGQNS